MDHMFREMGVLTELDVSYLNTSSANTMIGIFNGLTSITQLDVSNFDTSSVTSLQAAFFGMDSLTKLDLSTFDTSSVTNFMSAFNSMDALTTLNLNSWDVRNSTNNDSWNTDTAAIIFCTDADNGGTGAPGSGTIFGIGCSGVTFDSVSPTTMNSSQTVAFDLTLININTSATPLTSSDVTFNGASSGCSVSSIFGASSTTPSVEVTGCSSNGSMTIDVYGQGPSQTVTVSNP